MSESSVMDGLHDTESHVFLSYSSQALPLAMSVRNALEGAGVPCWMAATDVAGGEAYTTEIVRAIRSCRLFVVLLTEAASKSAHVMKEFDRAIAYSKPILPFKIGSFPPNESMEYFLSHVQWVTLDQGDPPAELTVIVEAVKSRLAGGPARNSAGAVPAVTKQGRRWPLLTGAGVLISAAIAWGIYGQLHRADSKQVQAPATALAQTRVFPQTPAEENAVKEMLAFVELKLSLINVLYTAFDRALVCADKYLTDPGTEPHQQFVKECEHAQSQINLFLNQNKPLSDGLRESLKNSPINLGDLAAFPDFVQALATDKLERLKFLPGFMDPNIPLDLATRRSWLDTTRKIFEVEKRSVMYSVCELLLPVSDPALEGFRTKSLPMLTAFGDDIPWLRDATEIRRRDEAASEKMKSLVAELGTLVGANNVLLQFMRQQQRDGTTQPSTRPALPSAAEQRVNYKQMQVEGYRHQIAEVQKQKKEVQERIREKFAPNPTDSMPMLWGKALRFLSSALPADAVRALQMYQEKAKDSDPNAATYVPAAIQFVQQAAETGINYGAIVVGYEPGKPPHPVFKIGDIVVAVNGIPTLETDAVLGALAKSDQGTPVTLLRGDAAGKLVKHEVRTAKSDTKFALLSLAEKND